MSVFSCMNTMYDGTLGVVDYECSYLTSLQEGRSEVLDPCVNRTGVSEYLNLLEQQEQMNHRWKSDNPVFASGSEFAKCFSSFNIYGEKKDAPTVSKPYH